jgi:hypothetical protein
MTKEEAITRMEEISAKREAEAEAARLAALPKAEVLSFEEAFREAMRPSGRWTVVPFGVTSYRPDGGPTGLEWEMMRPRDRAIHMSGIRHRCTVEGIGDDTTSRGGTSGVIG